MKTNPRLRLAVIFLSAFTTIVTAVAQVPRIDLVSPAFENVGTPVTISGANFSSVPADNIVYFGPVRAVVTSASANSLTTIVPVSATYSPITVTVGGRTAWANVPFTPTFSSSGRIDFSLFAPAVDLPAAPLNPLDPGGTIGVAIGDLDGDGKPDVVAVNNSAHSISLFRNISTAGSITTSSFESHVDISMTDYPLAVALGDLDGDGKLDIVVFKQAPPYVSLIRNTSTPGIFSFEATVEVGGLGNPADSRPIMIRDLDGDGRPELILAGYPGLYVLQNNSIPGTLTSSSFAAPVLFSTDGCDGLGVADFDGDGKPDIAMANRSAPPRVSVFRNTTTLGQIDSWSLAPRVDLAMSRGANNIAIVDFNNDGKPDLAVTGTSGPILDGGYASFVSVFENASSPGSITTGSFAARVDVPITEFVQDIAAADLDGDGKPDLATARYGGRAVVAVFQNAAAIGQHFTTESFANPLRFSTTDPKVVAGISFPVWDTDNDGFQLVNAAFSLATGDLDGDGMPDLVVGATSSDFISILRNTVPPCSAPPPVVVSASSINGENIAVRFDREVTCASALDSARYVVEAGAVSVNSVTMKPDHRTFVLGVSGLSGQPNTAFTLAASGIQACTQGAAGGGTVTGHVQPLLPLVSIDLGDPSDAEHTADPYRPTSVYAWRDER